MSQKSNLLYLDAKPDNLKQVKKYLDGAGVNFKIKEIASLSQLRDELENNDINVLLLDKLIDFDGQISQQRVPPIIFISNDKDENEAIVSLEKGWIQDYIVDTASGFMRLPLIIRAVFAREGQRSSISEPDLERLNIFLLWDFAWRGHIWGYAD